MLCASKRFIDVTRDSDFFQSIIECLRYAASNDLPPISKSSFVHDPKVFNDQSDFCLYVYCTVRLAWYSTQGPGIYCICMCVNLHIFLRIKNMEKSCMEPPICGMFSRLPSSV